MHAVDEVLRSAFKLGSKTGMKLTLVLYKVHSQTDNCRRVISRKSLGESNSKNKLTRHKDYYISRES